MAAEFSFGASHVRSQPRMQDELVLKRQLPIHAAQAFRFMEVVAMSGTKEFVTLAVTHDALFAVNPFSATTATVDPLVYLTDIQELNMLPGAVDVFMRKAVNASSAQVEIRTAADTISFFTFEEDTRIFFHIERAWTRRKARAARGLDIPPPLLTAHELRQLYHGLENELVGNGPCTAVVRGHGHNVAWTILQGRVDGASEIDLEAKRELAEFLSGRHHAATQSLERAGAGGAEDASKEHRHVLEQFRVKAMLAGSESPEEEERRNSVQWRCFSRRDDAVKWLLLSSGAGIPHNDATERRLSQLQTDATEFVDEKIELMRELREAAYFSPELKEAFYDSTSLLGFIVGDLQRYADPSASRSDETGTPRTTELEYVLECFRLLEAMTFDNECVRLREDVLNPRPYSVHDMFAVLCHDYSGQGWRHESQDSAGDGSSAVKLAAKLAEAPVDADGGRVNPASRMPALRSRAACSAMETSTSKRGGFANAVRMASAPAAMAMAGAGQSRWASVAGAALAQRKGEEEKEKAQIRDLLQQIDRAQVAVFVELNMTMQQTMVEGGNVRNTDTIAAFFALDPKCRPRVGAYLRQIIALLQESAKAKDDRRKAKVRRKQHRGQQRARTAQRKHNVAAKHRVDERGRRVERAKQGLDADVIRRLSLEGATGGNVTSTGKGKTARKFKGRGKSKSKSGGGTQESAKGDDAGESDEDTENGGGDNESSDEDYRSSDDEHEGRTSAAKTQLVDPKDREHSYVLWQHCRFLRTLALSNHKLRRFMRGDYEEEFSFFLSSSHFLTKFDHRLEFARLAKQDLLEIVRVVGFSVGDDHEQGIGAASTAAMQ